VCWCTWLTMNPQCTCTEVTLQTALQWPPDDGRTIALLHIITDVTRYTKHTVTDTVPSVHVYWNDTAYKPHCSYRQMMAVPSQCCTLSQTSHGTQNTLWIILCPQCTCTKVTPHTKHTAVTARWWPYHHTAAHYHRRHTVHRTHCDWYCALSARVLK